MALAANALTTVDAFMRYVGRSLPIRDLVRIYADDGTATAATVQVTATTIVLVVTGAAGTSTITLSAHATMTSLVTAINALGTWVAVSESGAGNADPADLRILGTTNALGQAAEITLTGIDAGATEDAINAASDRIETYCGRTFKSTTYEHLYNGTGMKRMLLRQTPIISVLRVAIGREGVVTVTNNSTDAQDALVSADGTNVVLLVVGGVNAGTDTLPYTTDPTLTEMVDAINAVGSGWSAVLEKTIAATWATADILEFSNRNALNRNVEWFVPDTNINEYDVEKEIGSLVLRGTPVSGRFSGGGVSSFGFGRQAIYPLEADKAGPLWPQGTHNVYVRYTAGYATIPADLVQVCHELANNYRLMASRDTGLSSENVDGYSFSQGEGPVPQHMLDRLTNYKEIVFGGNFVET